jgi:hypothetical protein
MDLRKELHDALAANDLASIAGHPRQRKVISTLIRLSYAKDTLVGWRAIIAVGMTARELIRTEYPFLRETCRKLLWSLSDESGGIGWSAPELLGEIVSADPHKFSDLVPLVATVYDVEEKVFRPGVLYALCRIAEKAPDLVYGQQLVIISSLVDRDPLVRIRGLQLAGLVWTDASRSGAWSPEYLQKVRMTIEQLRSDISEAWIYQEDGFLSVMVGDLAKSIAFKII